MKVYIEKEDKTKTVEAKNVTELLIKLKINPATVLVVVNNNLVTEDKILKKKDEVKVISVVSGG